MQHTNESIDASNKTPTDLMVSGGVFIPHVLLNGQSALQISAAEFVVLLHIVSRIWTSVAGPFPTSELIAIRTGKDRNTVRRNLIELEKKCLVRRVRQFDVRGQQLENGYDVSGLVEKLRCLASQSEDLWTLDQIAKKDPAEKDQELIRFNSLVYCFKTKQLSNDNDKLIKLTMTERQLLEILIRNANTEVSRDLLYAVTRGNLNRKTDRAVDLAIGRLRAKLRKAGAPKTIMTVYGAGYRLEANIELGSGPSV